MINAKPIVTSIKSIDLSGAYRSIDEFLTSLIVVGYGAGAISIYYPNSRFYWDQALATTSDKASSLRSLLIKESITDSILVDGVAHRVLEESATLRADEIDAAIAKYCSFPSFTIVVRSRFDRPYLLKRCLASIQRAFLHSPSKVEVVIGTDILEDSAQKSLKDLHSIFPGLTIRIAANQPSDSDYKSRVKNLINGIIGATNEYLWIVDDDDYVDIQSVQFLKRHFVFGNRPFLFTGSIAHSEIWDDLSSSKPVKVSSSVAEKYDAANWPNLFKGSNVIPVCGFCAPSEYCKERVMSFRFEHDLSEDYTLLLLLLTGSSIPEIEECSNVVNHISLRDTGDNVVNMADRSKWNRDICFFLSDLLFDHRTIGSGFWNVAKKMSERLQAVTVENRMSETDILKEENARLKSQLKAVRQCYATLAEIKSEQRP